MRNSSCHSRPANSPVRLALFGVMCALICLATSSSSHQALHADEQADLEQLLARLNLTELQIVHMEGLLQAQGDQKTQVGIAKQLSEAYIKALLAAAEDQERFQDYADRLRDLTNRFRETDSPTLQVMMLQAEYMRAEVKISEWLEDRSKTESLEEANKVLAPLVPQLQEHRTKLNENITRLNAELGEDESPTLDAIREKQIEQLSQVLFRATYFCGWANYYSGVSLRDAEKAKPQFTDARACFAEILAININGDYKEEVSPEWIDLDSIWVARSLLGLGLAEIGLQESDRSQICFTVLGGPTVPASLRTLSGYWQLQGWLNIGDLARAETLAAELLGDTSPLTESQQTGICVSLVRTAFSQAKSDSKFAALGDLGLRGLMRLRQFPMLTKLISDYDVKLSADDFYLAWLKGYQRFLSAEKTKDKAGYEAAAESMQRAVEMPDAARDVKSLAVCRYHLAWALFRSGKFDLAEKLLQQAFPALKVVDEEIAVQAAWLRYEALNELAKSDDSRRADALAALKDVVREFPDSQYARNADYQMARLKRASSSPDEIARDLEAISPDNPNYLNARYEVCLVYHQSWSEKREDPQADALKQKVFAAVDQFLRDSKGQQHERRLRAALIAVDVSVRSVPPDESKASAYLELAAEAESQVSSSSSAVIEYHYQRFQIARSSRDVDAAQAEAAWLIENGAGSPYQESAIILMAQSLDEKVAKAEGQAKLEHIREAIKTYEQMVSLFGSDPQQLKTNKNSRVSLSRLASYETELKMYDAAAKHLEQLVAAFPADENYLRKCGVALVGAGEYDKALPHWRKLNKGLDAKTDEWYEAKYNLMLCLAKTNDASAKDVYQQFETLYPELPENWKGKFAEVKKLLGM